MLNYKYFYYCNILVLVCFDKVNRMVFIINIFLWLCDGLLSVCVILVLLFCVLVFLLLKCWVNILFVILMNEGKNRGFVKRLFLK